MVVLFILALLAVAQTQDTCKRFSDLWPDAEKIVAQMTLEEKIGQMTQGDIPQIAKDHKIDFSKVQEKKLGSLLIGGNFVPGESNEYYDDSLDLTSFPKATPTNWKNLGANIFKPTAIKDDHGNTLYELYPFLGTDAVHGNQHVLGTVLFPHNIGLAATHDPSTFQDAGYFMSKDVLATGFNYAFAPTVAVSHNFQWGRHYETMGAEPEMIKQFSAAFVTGAQQYDASTGKYNGVLTSVKHFMGDGATYYGVDEGNCTVHNYKTFLDRNYQGYAGGISSCAGNIMCSYSAVNTIPMAGNAELLQGVLKDGIYDGKGFDGFVISDYDEIGKLSGQGWPTSNIKMDWQDSIALMINSGIDMAMLASTNFWLDIDYYQNNLKTQVEQGAVSMDRIDDAVKRILAVKMAMGLVKEGSTGMTLDDYLEERMPKLEANKLSSFDTAWEASLNAAQKSLVLLKNDNDFLPLVKSQVKYVVFIGERTISQIYKDSGRTDTVYQDYDNIGVQNGGWSLRWQGFEGNQWWSGDYKTQTHASSILDAFKTRFNEATLLYPTYDNAESQESVEKGHTDFITKLQGLKDQMTAANTVVMGVLAESPYAEMMGDIANPMCKGGEGCMYWGGGNPYMPDAQRQTLANEYDDFSKQVLQQVGSDIPLVSVLLSGRPMIVDSTIAQSEAFIAAWLPATQGGEAIVSALFGEYLFRGGSTDNKQNTLPIQWLKDMKCLEKYPIYLEDGSIPSIPDASYEIGYGLATKAKSAQEVTE